MRLFIFSALFVTNIVWSSYRAALTSALVAREVKPPFNSLDEFLASEYRWAKELNGHQALIGNLLFLSD